MLYLTMPNNPVDRRPEPAGTKLAGHRRVLPRGRINTYWSSVKAPASATTPFTYLTHSGKYR